jgi:ribonucleoside-diphosphate reductase alpha chain
MTEPQRSIANNSAVYLQKPSNVEFMDEWIALMKSGSGERGIFNRGSLLKTLPKRRIAVLKGYIGGLGPNPCGEIILQSKQFCNLSEVVARVEDDEKSLLRKIRVATILGTYQSTLTNFGYLSKEWKEHCDAERLLGVSITGQWDCPAVRDPKVLQKLKNEAIKINEQFAKRFGINASTCITCVKPSGTLSQTVDCSSGMHPRHAPFYIRRIRISATDALFKMLKDQGMPYYPEVGQSADSANTFVLEFPVKSPKGSIYKNDLTAIEQLEHWKMVKLNYTEHNPSVTISVGEEEWIPVAEWVYRNWDIIGGLSFLPRDNHVYQLAPYEPIDEKRYEEMEKRFKAIDYSKIITYEKQDETEVKKELACVAGVCEIV